MAHKSNSHLLPTKEERDAYMQDLNSCMLRTEVMRYFHVSISEVLYAEEKGYLIKHSDGNGVMYSTRNVCDWIRKKYGADVLTRCINELYAASAALSAPSSQVREEN